MAIRQFGTVSFAGVDLSTFGVTLSGVGTYNAPERDVEYVEVPGRNGDIIIDHGRFKNIEVTYPINIEDNLPDNIAALTAFLTSQRGYQRLEDTRHPDEYRMACFAGPLEVDPTGRHNRYGEAEVVFICKPQRFLKSGESAAITINPSASSLQNIVGDGDDLFNDGYKAVITQQGFQVTDNYMCVDVSNYVGGDYGIKLTYPAGTVPRRDNVFMPVGMAQDPFIGETYQFGYMAEEYLRSDNTITHLFGSGTWCVFITPLKAEIYRRSDVTDIVASILPRSTVITPPVSNLSYTPLIHFVVSGAVKSGVVLMLNESSIGLDTPASIGGLSITDIYIDCETFYAYAVTADATIPLNKYVTMNGDFVFNGPITVYSNSNFVSCEIMPRWWTL